MLLHELLGNTAIILGSQSPRRKELLASMHLDFEVLIQDTDESYDQHLQPSAIAEQIALKKLKAFDILNHSDSLIITADTIVVTADNQILGKPRDVQEAFQTLKDLAGQTHHVYTGVAFSLNGFTNWFSECTTVVFEELDEEMIQFYIDHFHPFDKAGSYGIQEWIGRVGVKNMSGTYENVMGLPTNRLYHELVKFIKNNPVT